MEFISTAKGFGRAGLFFITLEFLRQLVPQLTASKYGGLLFVLIIVGLLALMAFLLHVPLLLAIRRTERKPVGSGATMLVYGLLWLFSFTAGQPLGGIAGILLVIGGIVALMAANSPAYQSNATRNGPGYNYATFTPTSTSPGTVNLNPVAVNPVSFNANVGPLPNFAHQPPPPISFSEAVALAQAGRKQEAYQALKRLEDANPNELNILLWLAFTAPSLGEAQRAVAAAARLAPAHPSVLQAQQWLNNLSA
jgi:hypothetical protein